MPEHPGTVFNRRKAAVRVLSNRDADSRTFSIYSRDPAWPSEDLYQNGRCARENERVRERVLLSLPHKEPLLSPKASRDPAAQSARMTSGSNGWVMFRYL